MAGSRASSLFALFDGPCSLHGGRRPTTLWLLVFQASLISRWNWNTVKFQWRALISVAAEEIGVRRSCQAHTARQCVLPQEHGKATLAKRCRETNQLPLLRGEGLIPLCSYLHPLPTLLIYPCCFPEVVKRRGENPWFECLRQRVTIDGSQGGSCDNSLSSWLDGRYCHPQHHGCRQQSVSHTAIPKERTDDTHFMFIPSFRHSHDK